MKTEKQSKLQNNLNQNHQTIFDFRNLYCSKGHQATYLCQNKHCNNLSMICTTINCQCQTIHKKCLKTFSQELFTQISKKLHSTTNIKDKVDRIIDQAIDYISNIRDQIYVNLKYLGLNQDEKALMDLLQQKQFNEISGSKIWKICQGIYQQKQICSTYIIKTINSYWTSNQSKFKKCFQKLKELSEKQGKQKNIFNGSQILTKVQDAETLSELFSQQITKVKLLYSAKKSNYQMRKYHQTCQGKKNTLVVVKSKQGKIFGGFLAEQIPKYNVTPGTFGTNFGSVMQPSKKSFMFSLTNNDIFNLNAENVYLQFDPIQGPNFGNDCLGIYRQIPSKFKNRMGIIENPPGFGTGTGGLGGGGFANGAFAFGNPGGLGNEALNDFGTRQANITEHYCVVLENRIFQNESYESNSQSRIRMTGTQQLVFPIKQWQVYQLQFVKEDN